MDYVNKVPHHLVAEVTEVLNQILVELQVASTEIEDTTPMVIDDEAAEPPTQMKMKMKMNT